jgi:NitT/TauT family transport system permease protein
MFQNLFELRKDLQKRQMFALTLFGLVAFIALWQLAIDIFAIPNGILPTPGQVGSSFFELYKNDSIFSNSLYSIKLNVSGYAEAVLVSLPLGFIIGLFPFFRESTRKFLDAARFLPIPAMTGIFIVWFGIGDNMKIQFLAFSIAAYLIPAVVQRIQEIPKVYVDTVRTLSNSRWDVIKSVFMPAGLEAVYEDVRILVAISWTYIMVAELVNKTGGLGAVLYLAQRQGRMDKVFAVLVVITMIGLLQDRLFKLVGEFLFPYKSAPGANK